MASAPSAVSDMIRQYVNFSGSGETLRMGGVVALANVGTPALAGQFSGLIDGSGQDTAAMRLSPTSPLCLDNTTNYTASAFVSPALDLLGSAFTRYRANKLRFHYRPQTGTNSTQQLVFAFAADPCHPLIAPSLPAQPSTAGLESLSDSVPFAPWASWGMDVSKKLTKEWLYSGNSGDSDNSGSADSRFDCFGSIGCTVATQSGATAVNYGVLYMEFELEFKEFCPISVTRPSLLRSLQKKIALNLESHNVRAFPIVRTQREPMADEPESVLNSFVGVSTVVNSSSSSLPKQPTKALSKKEFLEVFRVLREQGMPVRECIKCISHSHSLGPEVINLIFQSRLEGHLSSSDDGQVEPEIGEKDRTECTPDFHKTPSRIDALKGL